MNLSVDSFVLLDHESFASLWSLTLKISGGQKIRVFADFASPACWILMLDLPSSIKHGC